jgi:Family of unknown function (DUF6361)
MAPQCASHTGSEVDLGEENCSVPSVLAWLDHDEAERRRMQEVIELFRERDTADELGIGSVRDAFSNLLFPGTSVLHSRARYFLFVPWIYLQLEQRNTPSAVIGARARRDEIRLIHALIEGGEAEGNGVIGAVARDRLKQLPSQSYWNGLEILGIRRFHGSIDRYHRSLDGYYRWLKELPKGEGGEPVEGLRANWHHGLPPVPDQFLEETNLELSPAEATYLRERIHASAPGTLLDAFVSRARPSRPVRFAWLHPDVSKLSSDLAKSLEFARVFSGVMHGAILLYNLMLAEARALERLPEYRSLLEEWADQVDVPAGWIWDEFWAVALLSNPRIPRITKRFIESWFSLAPLGRRIAEDRRGRSLIRDRERSTKGSQARLFNRRALELWGGGAGAAQLTYRWPVVERMVNDILKGIGSGSTTNAGA